MRASALAVPLDVAQQACLLRARADQRAAGFGVARALAPLRWLPLGKKHSTQEFWARAVPYWL